MKWENNAFSVNGGRFYSYKPVMNLAKSGQIIPDKIKRFCKNLYSTAVDSYAKAHRDIAHAPGGLKYFPYQMAGIAYMERHKRCLLADDQGLGKTIQIAGLINCLTEQRPKQDRFKVLIICPASLKTNWDRELEKWLVYDRRSQIVQGRKFKLDPHTDITIVNYEVCDALKESLTQEWDLVAIDEVHYLKNHTSKRTQAILGPGGIITRADRVVAMSGTPMSNRPAELWPLIASIFWKYWPSELIEYRAYGEYFCAGYDEQKRVRTKHGVKFVKEFNVRGCSNLPVLNALLRERFMLRREKAQVLPQLPPKIYSVIDVLPNVGRKKAVAQLLKQEGAYRDDVLECIETGQRLPPMEEMASVRQELGLEKIEFAEQFVRDILANDEPVIVFVYHTAVAEALAEKFADVGVSMIIGKTPMKKRADAVDNFQNGNNKVFIGNIQAAGTGLTLTKSSNVVFVEYSWVPGENEQAVDRAHRISQLKQVNAYFLSFFGSLDAQILKTSIRKQRNIDKVMK